MKKFVSLLLALLMIASLAACGKKANDDKTTDDSLSILENGRPQGAAARHQQGHR